MAKSQLLGGNELSLPHMLSAAISFHQKGKLAEAERLCLEILKIKPGHSDAQHMLGILRYQQGRNTEALELIAAALLTNPHAAGALLNFGNVLKALQRHEEALASYDKALAIKPDYAEALHDLSLIHI